MAGDRVSLDVSSSKLLEALTASNVPLLLSGRVAERFRNCSQNSDSVEVEIILKPDLMCAAKLMRAFDSILKDFVAGGSNIQDVNKMATPGFRIRPFLTSTDHLLTVAESVTAFEAMQVRSTLAAIFESNLMVLAIEDVLNYIKTEI